MVQIDMEMPQDCEHCCFGYVNYVTNVDGCELMDCLPNSPDCSACTPIGQRDKNCPLREVPNGKWVWVSSTCDRTPCEMRFMCSNCHHEIITHGQKPWQKFCPNCKVRMREDI